MLWSWVWLIQVNIWWTVTGLSCHYSRGACTSKHCSGSYSQFFLFVWCKNANLYPRLQVVNRSSVCRRAVSPEVQQPAWNKGRTFVCVRSSTASSATNTLSMHYEGRWAVQANGRGLLWSNQSDLIPDGSRGRWRSDVERPETEEPSWGCSPAHPWDVS